MTDHWTTGHERRTTNNEQRTTNNEHERRTTNNERRTTNDEQLLTTPKSILFHEEQRYRRVYLILVLLFGMLLPVGILVYMTTIERLNPMELVLSMAAVIALELPLFLIFYYTKFEKIVLSEGIGYRWWPLQRKYRMIFFNEIVEIHTRKSPSSHYGVHWVFKYGWVHNVKGNIGLQFKLKSGKKLFVGSGRVEELRSVLEKLLHKRIGEFRDEF